MVKTAGAEVAGVITQKVSKINPATLIGAGKAKQIISQAEGIGAKIIIFDDELSPAQLKNYHKMSKNIKHSSFIDGGFDNQNPIRRDSDELFILNRADIEFTTTVIGSNKKDKEAK